MHFGVSVDAEARYVNSGHVRFAETGVKKDCAIDNYDARYG
jgi:hypothetical protein